MDAGRFLALESKYRREGIYRMQQLQSQLTNLAVTADDHFDPARVIQELRRISAELDALGDKVVPARKVHTLLARFPIRNTRPSRPRLRARTRRTTAH